MDIQGLSQIITNLQSEDNTVRLNAEAQYNSISCEIRTIGLFTLLDHQPNLMTETLALILLRQIFAREFAESWPKISQEDQCAILQNIIEKTATTTEDSIRSKYIDVIAQIAHETIDEEGDQTWVGVLDFVNHCIENDQVNLQFSVMLLIESTPNLFGNSFKMDFTQRIPQLKLLFTRCLNHPVRKVCITAVKALVALLTENDDNELLIRQFSNYVKPILVICQNVVSSGEEDDSPLQALADLAATIPRLITLHSSIVLPACLGIASTSTNGKSYRHSALEVLLSYVEAAPKAMKKLPIFYLKGMLECSMCMLMDLEDVDESWVHSTEEDDPEEETAAIGESAIDRIACALNGKTVSPVFLSIVESFFSKPDWKAKHSALMAFSAVGEGCQRSLEPNIHKYVEFICRYTQDEHPRVRYAACNAIGQMSTDFAPTLQKKCHSQVVPALLQCLEKLDSPRVVSHAAAALINFCEECPQNVVRGYLPMIMQVLEQTLAATFRDMNQKKNKLIVEQVVTAIASVAEASQDLFKAYYSRLMPPLIFILDNTNVDNFKELRGKTIECISLIGTAVGKEIFYKDAIAIMQNLSHTMPTMAIDDPQCSYMISSWTRFCNVLGADFAPYLPMIMGPILRAAQYNIQYAVVDDMQKQEDPTWSYQSLGCEQNFGIRTAGLEEKVTACDMLVCYAKQLKEHFAEWVPQVAQISMSNLTFAFHDGVRQAAADVMPCLIECVKHQGIPAMQSLASEFIAALCSALQKEEDLEVKSDLISSLTEIIDALTFEGLTQSYLELILPTINLQIENYVQRKKEFDESEGDEEADDVKEDINDELELLSKFLGRIVEIVRSIMKETKGQAYDGLYKTFEIATNLMSSKPVYFERQWGACIMDDALEFYNGAVTERFPSVKQVLTSLLFDEYPEVRQAAAYGIGVMALQVSQAGIEAYLEGVYQALPSLVEMIQNSEARTTEEGIVATENAIAAFTKIMSIEKVRANSDINNVAPMFLSWLPTNVDQQESNYVYSYFCDLFDSNTQSFYGQENRNMPKILSVATTSLTQNAFEDTPEGTCVKNRVQELIKKMAAGLGEQVFTAVAQAAQLDESQTALISSIVSQI